MRLGIADHLGWAVAVVATADHEVVDRRRIELVEPDVPPMPIHHGCEGLDDSAAAALVQSVRESIRRVAPAEIDALPGSITSISLRTLPTDFPQDIATQRKVPWEARADAVMYREELVELAQARGWAVHLYDAKTVEAEAAKLLGSRADAVLHGPRERLGAPWAKDHRMALAATILAG